MIHFARGIRTQQLQNLVHTKTAKYLNNTRFFFKKFGNRWGSVGERGGKVTVAGMLQTIAN